MSVFASGHKAVPLEGEDLARLERDFTGYAGLGMVRMMPGGCLLPALFTRFVDEFYNFRLKPTDVYIMTWPKCGTTWMQEILWTMRNNPNLDNPIAASPMNFRVPYLEFDPTRQSINNYTPGPDHPIMQAFEKMCPEKSPENGVYLQVTAASPDPRTIKTHLPLSLLPPDIFKTSKVVHVARNPKDVIVSQYHHSRIFKDQNYISSFEDFVQYFIDGDLKYGPYWQHLKEGWEKREEKNLHFVFFEDLKSNNIEELKKLNKFLGTNLSDHQIEKISEYTSFNKMKKRNMFMTSDLMNSEIVDRDGGFFRKGNVGDWKGKYTPELEAKLDDWVKKHLSDCGINFKYVA